MTWVRELITSEGNEWNEELLNKFFWQKDVDIIKNTPISQVGNKDRMVWNYSNQGEYTVQSAYHQLQLREGQKVQ